MKSPQIQKNEINKKQDDKEPNLFHKINKGNNKQNLGF